MRIYESTAVLYLVKTNVVGSGAGVFARGHRGKFRDSSNSKARNQLMDDVPFEFEPLTGIVPKYLGKWHSYRTLIWLASKE